jgi:ABC-type methionine transport system ATPase subunit
MIMTALANNVDGLYGGVESICQEITIMDNGGVVECRINDEIWVSTNQERKHELCKRRSRILPLQYTLASLVKKLAAQQMQKSIIQRFITG